MKLSDLKIKALKPSAKGYKVSDGKHTGNGWFAWDELCPFHNDRHAGSLVIHKESGACRCFSCGAKQALKDALKAVNSYKEPYNEPLGNGSSTAYLTAYPTVETEEKPNDEAIKKELIRQAMSELGKRSAAKRGARNSYK